MTIYPAHKKTTTVGILRFMSTKNSMLFSIMHLLILAIFLYL